MRNQQLTNELDNITVASTEKFIVDEITYAELNKLKKFHPDNKRSDWENYHEYYMDMQRKFPDINTVPTCLRKFSPEEFGLIMEKGFVKEQNNSLEEKICVLEERLSEIEKRISILEEKMFLS